MRRGTPAAEIFGEQLFILRSNIGMSQRQVGAIIGAPAATVSQVEKGQRALKEPKIPIWAVALRVDESYLRRLWETVQSIEPDPPLVRRRASSTKVKELEDIISDLNGFERERVLGYIHALIEDRRLSDVK